jgi:hypothetical protein
MIEITFYDSKGNPTAYTEDGENIYLFSGTPVAYIDQESVIAYNGRYLGRFEDGWIFDNQGNRVFFTDNASGVPRKPEKSALKPAKGTKSLMPQKGIKQPKPMRPINSLSWANSGSQFFES